MAMCGNTPNRDESMLVPSRHFHMLRAAFPERYFRVISTLTTCLGKNLQPILDYIPVKGFSILLWYLDYLCLKTFKL
jgi:hypothetical protein